MAHVFSGRTGARILALRGLASGDRFGTWVEGAGDVDRDGYADVGGGAPAANGYRGYAQVFSGRTGKVLFTFRGDRKDTLFGRVRGPGDLDRDGWPDLLVGAWGLDPPTGTEYVRAFSGKDGSVLYTLQDASMQPFAYSLDGVGDVDRDGHADFAVGMGTGWSRYRKAPAKGLVRVYSGKDGKPLFTVQGSFRSDGFGFAVAGVGDADKDGVPDLAVGAPFGQGFQGFGYVDVFSGKDGKPLYRLHGRASAFQFGRALDGIGDLDQDGTPDIAVGAPLAVGLTTSERVGEAEVFSGRSLAAPRTGTFVTYGGSCRGSTVPGCTELNGSGGSLESRAPFSGGNPLVLEVPRVRHPLVLGFELFTRALNPPSDPASSTVRTVIYLPDAFGRPGQKVRIGMMTVGGRPASPAAVLITGTSRTRWAMNPLPWDLSTFGAPGCALQASVDLLRGTGAAAVRIPVPNSTGLAGATLFHQWSIADPKGNRLGLVFSNAGEVSIGRL